MSSITAVFVGSDEDPRSGLLFPHSEKICLGHFENPSSPVALLPSFKQQTSTLSVSILVTVPRKLKISENGDRVPSYVFKASIVIVATNYTLVSVGIEVRL
jgi:hypothetical protein